MSDLERFRNIAQRITQGGQDILKENIDDPVEAMRKQQQIEALRQQEAAMQPQLLDPTMPNQVPEVNVPRERLGEFNESQVRGLEAMAKLKERDAQLKQQLLMEEAARAQSQSEFDPSSYQKVDRSRFNSLKERFK
jgi:hypothetical protein